MLQERGSEEEGEGLTQASSDSLYVVECVKLDLQVEDEPLSLTKGAHCSLPHINTLCAFYVL